MRQQIKCAYRKSLHYQTPCVRAMIRNQLIITKLHVHIDQFDTHYYHQMYRMLNAMRVFRTWQSCNDHFGFRFGSIIYCYIEHIYDNIAVLKWKLWHFLSLIVFTICLLDCIKYVTQIFPRGLCFSKWINLMNVDLFMDALHA